MAKVFRGDAGLFGAEEKGAIIYEAMFPKVTAQRLVQLMNRKTPPA